MENIKESFLSTFVKRELQKKIKMKGLINDVTKRLLERESYL